MRVIAGTAKGRQLKAPKTDLRPLSDRAKEALFNILAPRIEGEAFLDLFAGSGSVGIEALSRGASLSFFVEINRPSVEVIRENLEKCKLYDRAEIYCLPVIRALKIFSEKEAKFDIIFLGAPYGSPFLKEAMNFLADGKLLKENGIVIAEHRSKQDPGETFGVLKRYRIAKYGEVTFSFYASPTIC